MVNITDITSTNFKVVLQEETENMPFICTLPFLIKEEIYSMTISSISNFSVELSKVNSSLIPGVTFLCRGKENKLSKQLDDLRKRVDLELLKIEEKDPSIHQMLERLATLMEPRNLSLQLPGCWPHYIKPLQETSLAKPICQANLKDQEKNRRSFVKYLHQIQDIRLDVQLATLKIEGASWVHLEVFSAGSFSAFLNNFGPNTRSVYLGSMLIMSCLGSITTVAVLWWALWRRYLKRSFKVGCLGEQRGGCVSCFSRRKNHREEDEEEDGGGNEFPLVSYSNRRMMR